MLNKTQLNEIFIRHDFAPLKRLGENYLIDGNIRDKIISVARLSKDDIVLEIGPGLGALTLDLAKTGASVIAVEKDKKACAILTDLVGSVFPNLEIVNADVLKFDMGGAVGSRKLKVIGNLPYYITTPVIEYLLRNKDLVTTAIIMVQKEVASRLLAKPGTKDYSSLSCFVQYHTRPEYIYTVKRTCFYPAPKVDSAIVRMDVLGTPSVRVKDEERFFRIVRGAFNQRRKSIVNSLSREAVLNIPKDELTAILNNAGIDPAARPETLNLSDFAKIDNARGM
jgi:16S rRNA (adenine1518-N6/adenine1519-N6)-dimethyltransferase